MASFQTAYDRTLQHEGGYVNDPNDPGQETYCGISRRYHPEWAGWEKIDQYKQGRGFPGTLDMDAKVGHLVSGFYQDTYWEPTKAQTYRYQEIANEMFDIAVHLGVQRAVKFMQTALNILNKNESLYPNILVDGHFGLQTLASLNTYQNTEPPAFLHKLLLIQRGAFYIDAVAKREESEAYIRGWLRRVTMQ